MILNVVNAGNAEWSARVSEGGKAAGAARMTLLSVELATENSLEL
jgi:hypothetical protein